ncbi:MAG: hypothetical protein LBB43_03715 [Spirochaetaceae bacterium]|jgi:hypothetical protein|nr:hypothetical protein [Spirochaetaceae bacterium]
MNKKIHALRFVSALAAAALIALSLTGCPDDTGGNTGGGTTDNDEVVLLNEKAKYRTLIPFQFTEADAGTIVTEQFIQLEPGKMADHEITVSIASSTGNGYFILEDGKIIFTGLMPAKTYPSKGDTETEPKEDEEVIEREEELFSNGGTITLLFEKGMESVTLEVVGIVEKEGATDPERIAVTGDDTFLLYGYDVINSGYISRSDVKITRPILDLESVNAADMVRRTATTSSKWESASGESVKELFESLNVTASAEYKGVVFSGKVSAEFSTSKNSTQTKRYAKGRGFHITQDEYLRNTAPSVLKTLLDDTFKTDVNSKSAAYILDSYGTHLIARAYWGGEAEFNYSYTGSSLTNTQDITVALNATYGGFTGSASTDAKNKATELNSNSSFTSSSRGGNNTSFMTAEQFTSGYDAWVQSVRSKPDLCGIPNFNNDLIPIWTIAAEVNPAKATQIKTEFDKRVETRGVALAGFKYTPPPSPDPVYTYVTSIDVRNTSSSDVPSGFTNLVKTDMYNPGGGSVLDANAKAGGSWLRIPYQTTARSHNREAIAEIDVVSTGSSSTRATRSGWTTINMDLNKGAGGPYLWLMYRKVNQNDTQAIDFIGSYCESGAGSGQINSGYSWVGGRIDLNKSAGGHYVYLTVHKSPFRWQ